MVTVFTLCSANYLAQALTLGDSLKEQNPDYHFVIGLVDLMPKELAAAGCPYEVIPVEQLNIPGFWDMVQNYNIVELNTAVKPFYLEYLYQRDARVRAVIYIDPDILVCSTLEPLERKLSACNIILTPHNCTYDNSDANMDYELAMLNLGVYNLGFIATARSEVTSAFIKWWEKRLQHLCYYQPGSGFFVDQLWATLAPLYFDGVQVEKDPGYNMAYWNLFERRLSQRAGAYFVNEKHRLVFFHFSGYSPEHPDGIVKRPRLHVPTFADRPDLRPLFDEYGRRVLARNYTKFKPLKYSLGQNLPQTKLAFRKAIKKRVRNVMGSLPPKLQAKVVKLAQSTINSFK